MNKRSYPMLPLFVPADRPDRYEKAFSAGTDAVFIDLEDAVAPANKAIARRLLCARLPADLAKRAIKVFVRINGTETPWHDDDLDAVKNLNVDGIVLPKAERAVQFTRLRTALGDDCSCLALVETALGLSQLRTFAAAADQLLFGSLDLCADLGCSHDRDILLPSRFEVVLASRLAGLPPPLDGVTTAATDFDAVLSDARHAASLGFSGKLLIHPAQIAAARSAFRPTDKEVEWARTVLMAEDGGVSTIDGMMIDAPVIARARAIVARAERLA